MQRHIYSVPLPTSNSTAVVKPTALTDVSSPAVYDASFSPQGGFYLLTYKGPQAPWQKVIESSKKGKRAVSFPKLVMNEARRS